jgi:hypothetical protein
MSKKIVIFDGERKKRPAVEWFSEVINEVLEGFVVEDDVDNSIYDNIQYQIDNWDYDGRCFRDCTWNYDELFGLVQNKELVEDLEKLEEFTF